MCVEVQESETFGPHSVLLGPNETVVEHVLPSDLEHHSRLSETGPLGDSCSGTRNSAGSNTAWIVVVGAYRLRTSRSNRLASGRCMPIQAKNTKVSTIGVA